jgi:hypothetical protein
LISDWTSFGFFPSTVHPMETAVPRTSMTTPCRVAEKLFSWSFPAMDLI